MTDHSISTDIVERLREFAAYGDSGNGRILAQLAITEIERLRALTAASDAAEWIDQNHQIDRYGVALMMIREGCADPAGLARRILSEFGSATASDAVAAELEFANEAARKYKARLDYMEAKYGAIDWDAKVTGK